VIVLAALIVQVVLVLRGVRDVNATTSGEGESASTGTRLVNLFSYFTVQSNVLVIVAAGSLALRPDRDGRLWRVVRLDMVLGIVITGIVFGGFLAGLVHPTGISAWVNVAFHYFAPWWALAGWLLFGPRPRIDWRTVGWIFVWPIAWMGYTFIRGAATGFYPYPFLDADELGLPTALRNTFAVVILAGLLALLLRFLDRRLSLAAPVEA
jgi:hypothetical protein